MSYRSWASKVYSNINSVYDCLWLIFDIQCGFDSTSLYELAEDRWVLPLILQFRWALALVVGALLLQIHLSVVRCRLGHAPA